VLKELKADHQGRRPACICAPDWGWSVRDYERRQASPLSSGERALGSPARNKQPLESKRIVGSVADPDP
jgi:hypothetical protein